ncbi:MAG: ABC transporter substrate-binding protein [Verrucomicrobiota bacterium]
MYQQMTKVHRITSLLLLILFLSWISCSPSTDSNKETVRIVSLGTMPTETIVSLGCADRLVGIDQSAAPFSYQAPNAQMLNYHRQTSSEGVISLRPSHFIFTDAAGPEAAIEQIKGSGIQYLEVKEPSNWEEVVTNIESIATFIGADSAGKDLVQQMNDQKSKADSLLESRGQVVSPKVLFVLSSGNGGSLLCAGTKSGAGTVIQMAGGENAAYGFDGYKPISSEALAELNPDIILYPTGGGPHGGNDMDVRLKENSGLKSGKAVAEDQVYGVDMTAMLGFGPSLGPQLVKLVGLFYSDPQDHFSD